MGVSDGQRRVDAQEVDARRKLTQLLRKRVSSQPMQRADVWRMVRQRRMASS